MGEFSRLPKTLVTIITTAIRLALVANSIEVRTPYNLQVQGMNRHDPNVKLEA